MNKTTDYSMTREQEYAEEVAAIEREAYETFCEEQGFDPESEEAETSYVAYVEHLRREEEREAYDDRRIEEYEMRLRDIEEERDLMWE